MRPVVRVARALAPGLLVFAPAAAAVAGATARASWATLGRDQGIFQYVAWAVRGGARAYADVRDVNGPLVTLVHVAMQALGGEGEHRFRVLDLAVTGATAAFAGACLPSLTAAAGGDGRARAASRVGWALAAWAVFTSQYLAFGYWDTAQRESFFDWFVLVALGLQLVAEERLARGARGGAAALVAAGAFSIAPWLGKPTYACFTLAALAVLLADALPVSRARRAAAFAAGGALGAAVPLAFLTIYGDPVAWLRITARDVPAMYRFIWPHTAAGALLGTGHARLAELGAAFAVAVAGAVAAGWLPRRALAIAALPVCGLASVVAQAKGFSYHFHPVAAGVVLSALALLHAGWERASRASRGRAVATVAAVAASLALGARAASDASRAPFPPAPPLRDAASLASEARLRAFERVDFFPFALREAAAFVAARSAPSDTVQTYGMDPYVLFLAKRRSATPYVYAYDLDVDAALHGSFDDGGPRPDTAQRARIRAMRDEHERDMLARLERAPPAAFVFVGRSPLMSSPDAELDFAAHCPDAARWLAARYRRAADFDGVVVWLRNDLDI